MTKDDSDLQKAKAPLTLQIFDMDTIQGFLSDAYRKSGSTENDPNFVGPPRPDQKLHNHDFSKANYRLNPFVTDEDTPEPDSLE